MLKESLIAMLAIAIAAPLEAAESKSKLIGSLETIVKSKPSPLEKKIAIIRDKYLQERDFERENYLAALYSYTYFNWEKAEGVANQLVKEKKIKEKDKELFIRACRKLPFIKFYSQKVEPKLDPRFVFWVALTESHLKNIKGDHGEIGDMQIKKDELYEPYREKWHNIKYWIEGKGPENAINNYIIGINHLAASVDNAGCPGIPLKKLKARQLLSGYAWYARNRKRFESYEEPQYNLEAEARMHFYLYDLIDEYSSKANLISEKGQKLLDKCPKEIARID